MKRITPTKYWTAVKRHNKHVVRMLLNAEARGDRRRADYWASMIVDQGFGSNTNHIPSRYLPLSDKSLNIKE